MRAKALQGDLASIPKRDSHTEYLFCGHAAEKEKCSEFKDSMSANETYDTYE